MNIFFYRKDTPSRNKTATMQFKLLFFWLKTSKIEMMLTNNFSNQIICVSYDSLY